MSALGTILGIDVSNLLLDPDQHYTEFKIKPRKFGGKFRAIIAPDPDLKYAQQLILDRVIGLTPPHSAATAFYAGKSIADNARRHHRCAYLLKTDLKNFFPSITVDHVNRALSDNLPHLSHEVLEEVVLLTTFQGKLPQGAPTSPHISNIVMYRFDEVVSQVATLVNAQYTRYADDIAISANSAEAVSVMEKFIDQLTHLMGFRRNNKKTRRFGPEDTKIITGLDVSLPSIRPTRSFRRKAGELVRICVKYPREAEKILPKTLGYLSHWKSVAPDDPELKILQQYLGEHKRFRFRRRTHRPSAMPRMRIKSDSNSDGDLPF